MSCIHINILNYKAKSLVVGYSGKMLTIELDRNIITLPN